jgi:hypothetical protein
MSGKAERKIRRQKNKILRELNETQVIQFDKYRAERRQRWLWTLAVMAAVTLALAWLGSGQ